jgi:hypothetical protein
MMRYQENMVKKAVHEEILELLPWFINESLGEKERDRVMVHLRECPECRKERDHFQTIEAFVNESEVVIPDYQFSYHKLAARIEGAERNRESSAAIESRAGARSWIPLMGIAASLMLAIALVGSLGTPLGFESTPETAEFRTLTSQAEMSGVARQIALTFVQPIQAQTMRKALIETNSNIISGPDEEGTYLVEVIVPPEMQTGEFMQWMSEIEGVQHARIASTQDMD